MWQNRDHGNARKRIESLFTFDHLAAFNIGCSIAHSTSSISVMVDWNGNWNGNWTGIGMVIGMVIRMVIRMVELFKP